MLFTHDMFARIMLITKLKNNYSPTHYAFILHPHRFKLTNIAHKYTIIKPLIINHKECYMTAFFNCIIEDKATQLSQTLNGIGMYRDLEYLNIIKDLL